jgi:hypothetical protein
MVFCRGLFYVCINLELEAFEGRLRIQFPFGCVLILSHNLGPNFAEILVFVEDQIWGGPVHHAHAQTSS